MAALEPRYYTVILILLLSGGPDLEVWAQTREEGEFFLQCPAQFRVSLAVNLVTQSGESGYARL